MPTATVSPPTALLTREEAAVYLGVKPQTLAIWHSTHRYRLPVVKVGHLCRYRLADLEKWVASRVVQHGGE